MKECYKCKNKKSLTDFGIDKSRKDGLNIYCKICYRSITKLWQDNNLEQKRLHRKKSYRNNTESAKERMKSNYKKNKTKIDEQNKLWVKNNPEKVKEIAKKYRKNNPEKARRAKLKSKYNLSLSDYNTMLELQNYRCAICREVNPVGKNLYVDHCHTTGKVRGLLCQGCNSGIGYLKDSLLLLNNSIKYLENHNCPTCGQLVA